MVSSAGVAGLIAGMLLTGASNSLFTKYQDMQCVEDCNTSHPRLFEAPVLQSWQMFIGEMLCFLPVIYAWASAVYKRRRAPVQLPEASEAEPQKPLNALSGWAILLMWIPAICDLTGTTLMNVGLLYTPVSIYQMTRGGLVLFVAVFSVAFLRRRLWTYQWLALVTVMAGVSLVGLSGSLLKEAVREGSDVMTVLARTLADVPSGDMPTPEPIEKPAVTKVLLGVFLILFAQIFTATQFVVEEKIMSRYEVEPLMAVGLEGFFGALSIGILLPIVLALFPLGDANSTYARYFDVRRNWKQMVNTPAVLWTSLAIMCSISLFNFFGLSVTRHVSATVRSLTDTCRTIVIWVVSLGLGWERLVFPLSLLQISGFALLVYGTFLFNNLVRPPFKALEPPAAVDVGEEARGLLASADAEAAEAATADLPAAAATGRVGFDVVPTHGQGATGVSSGGVEALRPSEQRSFDVAGQATSRSA